MQDWRIGSSFFLPCHLPSNADWHRFNGWSRVRIRGKKTFFNLACWYSPAE